MLPHPPTFPTQNPLSVLLGLVIKQKEFVHLVLAEPTPRIAVENIGYFVMNGATQENGNLMLKGPNSLWHVDYRL